MTAVLGALLRRIELMGAGNFPDVAVAGKVPSRSGFPRGRRPQDVVPLYYNVEGDYEPCNDDVLSSYASMLAA